MTLQLIIHADDLGLAREIDDGIFHAHLNGVVTSASICACGRSFSYAVERAQGCPSLDLGVHLTLVGEEPVSEPASIPSLLHKNSALFPSAATFVASCLRGSVRLEEVRAELICQLDTVRRTGLRITHIDSHQHLHVLPRIRELVTRLAHDFGVGAIRLPRERLRPYMVKRPIRMLQALALRRFCHSVSLGDLTTTDAFAGFFFGGRLDRVNLDRLIRDLPRTGSCEIMSHPGHPPADPRYDHWHYEWSSELEALTEPTLAERLQERGASLIGYRDLAPFQDEPSSLSG